MFVFYVNMVIWFVIIKKREFVEPILMYYKVLMITNTNIIVHLVVHECDVQIGPG